jgi:hypothetical protein
MKNFYEFRLIYVLLENGTCGILLRLELNRAYCLYALFTKRFGVNEWTYMVL